MANLQSVVVVLGLDESHAVEATVGREEGVLVVRDTRFIRRSPTGGIPQGPEMELLARVPYAGSVSFPPKRPGHIGAYSQEGRAFLRPWKLWEDGRGPKPWLGDFMPLPKPGEWPIPLRFPSDASPPEADD